MRDATAPDDRHHRWRIMSPLAQELIALLVYAPCVVLLHELGHAIAARPGGYRVTSFGIGLGAPLWTLPLRDGVVLHVDWWVLAGGACTAIPAEPPTARRAWFHGCSRKRCSRWRCSSRRRTGWWTA